MTVVEIHEGKSEICREVLADLPRWFGVPESTSAYVAASASLPMFARLQGTQPAGFVSLKLQTPFAHEIYVLGVKRRFHRRGIGLALIEAAGRAAAAAGSRFLTVKTLAPSHPDSGYAATRLFYEAAGFMPLEVFPALWSDEHPCLMMVKTIESARTGHAAPGWSNAQLSSSRTS
jgi:ribosomal protein S18 acetylase RimI-like enzyme